MLSRKEQCKWRCRLMPFQIAFILLHHLVISVNLHLYDLKLFFHILHKSLISLCLVAIFTYTKEGTRGCLNQHITHTHTQTHTKMLGGTFLHSINNSSFCHPFVLSKSCKDLLLWESCKLLLWCEPTIHVLVVCWLVCVSPFKLFVNIKVTVWAACWPLCVSVLRSPCELLVDHCHCMSSLLTALCVIVWVVCWQLCHCLGCLLTTACVTELLADHFVSLYVYLLTTLCHCVCCVTVYVACWPLCVSLFELLTDWFMCYCICCLMVSCLLTALCVTV